MNRINILVGYCVCAAVMLLGMQSLRSNLQPMFDEVEADIESGRTIVLDLSVSADTVSSVLLRGGYLSDERDADLTARWIVKKIRENGGLENLGRLNMPSFKMPADTAIAMGGRVFASRVNADCMKLGVDDEWRNRGESLSSTLGDESNDGRIEVKVVNRDAQSLMDVGGIAVRLTEYTYDSVETSGERVRDKNLRLVAHNRGYAVTDKNGVARFNVRRGGSYSVLPIKPGSQFGQEKGTTNDGRLDGPLSFTFKQSPHVLSPMSSTLYQMLKGDNVFIVRTPDQFRDSCDFALAVYLCGWAMLLLFLIWRDARMHTVTDYLLVIIVMGISGIGLLATYSMTNPLIDKANGYTMAIALLVGLIVLGVVSSINFVKFYNGKSRVQMGFIPFDVIDSTIRKRLRRRDGLEKRVGISFSSGFMYLAVALCLIGLLAVFGTGPEGSDARVNLFGFQPSELSKYLIIIFIAAFFAENATLLQAFSEKLTKVTARRQLATVGVVVGVMLILMLVYLKVLSDMGPAIVLMITFIMIYSMARRDFAQLLLGLVSFIALLGLAAWQGWSLLIASFLWFAVWIGYGWFRYHRVYESAIVLNMLIVVFLLGDQILMALGADSEAARLANRTAMAGVGVWDNTVPGGDQVAQGLWSLSTGGITGMGLGKSSASLVPACHTDMAFTSVGEMLGLVGLLLLIVCFVLLIHRTLLIGKRAGHPFVMYLVMGVGIVTGVQFLFIVFGSLGIIPLTGISVPFISYGQTSFIVTMAMFGIVVSASRVKATESQIRYANTYNQAIAAGALLFILGGVGIIATLIKYQIVDREKIMVRPAFITNTFGERVIEYNPRINMILRKLHSGNIYDRNGLLLATSSREEFIEAIPELVKSGLSKSRLLEEANKRYRRYYPFGDHTLFMVGDANTREVYSYSPSDPTGYLAESRHFAALRDLDIRDSVYVMVSDRYKANRFMPDTTREFKRIKHDYRVMIDFLNHGVENNPLIDEHNARRPGRDFYLTLDARLQTKMQEALASFIGSDSRTRVCDNIRASVVVLNASNGDLLCSANYPLPNQDSIAMLRETRNYSSNPAERIKGHAPLTERDLATTFPTAPGSTAKVMSAISGLMKDPSAGSTTYKILGYERIEGGAEPAGDFVTMYDAIRLSSNNYFINLVNSSKTYPQLEQLYSAVGARVEPIHRFGGVTPYFFDMNEFVMTDSLHRLMGEIERDSYRTYDNIYMRQREGRLHRKDPRWNISETAFAWGQGGLRATPLTMARVASIVANNGCLMPTRYVMRIGNHDQPRLEPVQLISASAASDLKGFMQAESDKHRGKGRQLPGIASDRSRMGGKTGTPERYDKRGPGSKANDVWYICFINSEKEHSPLAIALRLERTTDYRMRRHFQSGLAVDAVAKVVIPVLNDLGYDLK